MYSQAIWSSESQAKLPEKKWGSLDERWRLSQDLHDGHGMGLKPRKKKRKKIAAMDILETEPLHGRHPFFSLALMCLQDRGGFCRCRFHFHRLQSRVVVILARCRVVSAPSTGTAGALKEKHSGVLAGFVTDGNALGRCVEIKWGRGMDSLRSMDAVL